MTLTNVLRWRARLAVVLAVLLASGAAAIAQQAQDVAGTTVTLVPPEGFAPGGDFTGFIHEDGIGMVVVEQGDNIAAAQSVEAFSTIESARKHFEPFGHEVLSLETVETEDGADMPLFSGRTRTFDQSGRELVVDWWLTYAVGQSTVVVSIRSDPRVGLTERDVIDTFASIEFGAVATLEEQVSGLPYTIEPADPYRLVSTVSGRQALLTDGEEDTDPSGQNSNVILAYEWAEGASADQVAEAHLAALGDPSAVTVNERDQVDFAGDTGRILEGHAETPYGPKSFLIYAAVHPDGYRTVLLATFPRDEFSALRPSVERIAQSVTLKE